MIKDNSKAGSPELREITNSYGLIDVKSSWDGYILFFETQDGAFRAIIDWWAKVWSATPDYFSRGMWKPGQQLTGGADYRTQILDHLVTAERKAKGITCAIFIGGNEERISEKGRKALIDLGLL